MKRVVGGDLSFGVWSHCLELMLSKKGEYNWEKGKKCKNG